MNKISTGIGTLLVGLGLSLSVMAQAPGQQPGPQGQPGQEAPGQAPGQAPGGQAPGGQAPGGQPPAGQAPGGLGQEAPVQNFSDQDIQSFVEVQGDLQSIRVEYSEQLQSTDDPAVAAELQQEASEQMLAALEDHGLDVQTYSSIVNALQTDPELRGEVEQMLEES